MPTQAPNAATACSVSTGDTCTRGRILAALWLLALTLAPIFARAQEVTDLRIADAVEDELLYDQAVSPHKIDVAVHEGVVTLSGQVDNVLANERAVGLAETVKGVRAIVDEIEVVPSPARSDRAIAADVEQALLADPTTESYEVDVAVDDGVVTLTGSVGSWQEKRFAGKVAKGVSGVTETRNFIDIQYREDRADSEIRWDIEEALRWDALIDDARISIEVSDGEVELRGVVGSAAEKTRAVGKAWVAGVRDVDASELAVTRWARDDDLREDKYVAKSDTEVEQAVEDALLYDPRVASIEVTPIVAGGVVTLRGTVDNLRAKRAAAQDARNTVGVLAVRNRLKVRPSEVWADTAIAAGIRDAMRRDPLIEKDEITVSVVGGVANLYGTVDSYFEKGHADDIASTAKGVVDVNNQLKVFDTDPLTYEPYLGDYDFYEYDWYDYEPQATFSEDGRIAAQIEAEMYWSPFVDEEEVIVTVEDGVATLSGTVDSHSEVDAAVESAWEGGAIWVDNGLEIATGDRN